MARLLRRPSATAHPDRQCEPSVPNSRLTGRNLKSVSLRVTARISFPADIRPKLEIGRLTGSALPDANWISRARSRIGCNVSSRSAGPGAVSGTGHLCAGHLVAVCLALTLSWSETLPLLRWAQSLRRAGPYYARPPRGPRLDGSSHSLRGPEPHRQQWLVPFSSARSRVHFRAGHLVAVCWVQSLWRAGPYYARLPRLDGSSHSLGARSCVGDRPLVRWEDDHRMFGPYFALGRDLATFALGAVSMVGPPYYAAPEAATRRRLVPLSRGPEPCRGPAKFCAGHMITMNKIVEIWAKRDPIWAKVGKSALDLAKK